MVWTHTRRANIGSQARCLTITPHCFILAICSAGLSGLFKDVNWIMLSWWKVQTWSTKVDLVQCEFFVHQSCSPPQTGADLYYCHFHNMHSLHTTQCKSLGSVFFSRFYTFVWVLTVTFHEINMFIVKYLHFGVIRE